ncbi:fatty acid--CoA ligase [Solwaraspora sp. WMMD1047]|uniref:fatty acid--CoA ligase n=1 Tax=Solwaraspora sp. WMMD1047 TaxID=3016102 RepID=UPI002415D027|nr:fatty acid--CoA ligase [Solwaraspora sp. WMMD1047]MDG4834326.1 fatty acid--CoA ligase [Solwaraspora sp. WMMD1047]
MPDAPLTVPMVLRHAFAVHAAAEVVTAGETDRRVSFAALQPRIARLANGLRALGVGAGDRVATYLWNNQEHLEAYAAVPAMGAVLHTLNVRLSVPQNAYVAGHAGDGVVVVGENLVESFARLLPRLDTVHTVLVTGAGDGGALDGHGRRVLRYEEVLAGADDQPRWPALDERSAAAMCYTSGTTGAPKGVVYSHRSTVLHSMSVCSGNAVGMSARDRALVLVPMFHANAWGWPYAALMAGTSLVLPDRDLSPERVVGLIERERVTVTGGVPTLWTDVLHQVRARPADLSSLRLVLCGGSAVPAWLLDAYRDEVGVPLVQAWGMTEVSPLGAVAHTEPLSQGRLLFGVEGRLVDDGGACVPRDGAAVGELQVRGPWVTASYHGDADPAAFDGGWLRTGDVGTLDPGGHLRLTDRAKDVIKSGGEWISSVELENQLAAHPGLAEAVVIGVPDPRWQERPLAVVVPAGGAEVEPAVLRAWLADRVPRWWVPERWSAVAAVPRTSVGKFDKVELRRRYAEGLLPITTVDGGTAR